MRPLTLALLTVLTLFAFAGNSLLGRMALAPGWSPSAAEAMDGRERPESGIDPASYTLIRLASGAAMLAWLSRRHRPRGGDWASALALFAYAAGFSFAYISLDTGIGALLLFAAVQITMIGAGLRAGERLHTRAVFGMGIAALGLVLLLRPGEHAPTGLGSALMLAAGVAWGVYSLRGRGSDNALAATAGNFLRAAGMAALLALAYATHLRPHGIGVLWAIISGAITSGLGYALWYRVLPQLSAVRAATVQLAVPVLAAALGVVVLSEPLTSRLLIAGALVLSGVGLSVARR